VNTELAQDSRDAGSQNKPEPECGAEQSHSFCPISFGRHVGDIGLCGRDICAGYPAHYSPDKYKISVAANPMIR
jgi:hypothetical protein